MPKEQKVIFTLGTNKNQEFNMQIAMKELQKLLPRIVFSRKIYTKDVNGGDSMYLNCVAKAIAKRNEKGLRLAFRNIERICGTRVATKRRGEVAMDIDLIFYKDHKLKPEEWEKDYVKELLFEIVTPQTIEELTNTTIIESINEDL